MDTATVVASGYFDPLHAGHVDYLRRAKALAQRLGGDRGRLIVIVNTDQQAALKKGRAYMPLAERMEIVRALRYVDDVVPSIDEDRTVCKTLEMLKPAIFAKGGDRTAGEVPEAEVCDRLGTQIVDGLGEKIASSSQIAGSLLRDVVLDTHPIPMGERTMVPKPWGYEDWVANIPGLYCGKRLFIRAGAHTSWHYHKVKDETLYVQQGRATVRLSHDDDESRARTEVVQEGESMRLRPGTRHRIVADGVDMWLYEFSTVHHDDDVVRPGLTQQVLERQAS